MPKQISVEVLPNRSVTALFYPATAQGLWKSDVKFSATNVPGYTLSASDSDEKWDAYIHESVLQPDAKIVEGYNNVMPSFAAEQPKKRVMTGSAAKSGAPHPNFVRGGLKEGFVRTSAYGPAAQGKDKADAAKAAMLAGSLTIYKGGLKDNKGNVVIPAGATYATTEPKLESMNYLVEGVVGSTS